MSNQEIKSKTNLITNWLRQYTENNSEGLGVSDIYESNNTPDGPGFCFDIDFDGGTYNVEVTGPAYEEEE